MKCVKIAVSIGLMTVMMLSSISLCYGDESLIDPNKLDGYSVDGESSKFENGFGIIKDTQSSMLRAATTPYYGLIDENYNVIIKPDRYRLLEFENGYENYIYAYVDPAEPYGDIYKISNNKVTKITTQMCNFNDVSYFNNNILMVVKNESNQVGVVGNNGMVMPFTKQYEYAVDGPFIIRADSISKGQSGRLTMKNAELFDLKGNKLTTEKYDGIEVYLEKNQNVDKVFAIKVFKGDKENVLSVSNYKEILDWSYKMEFPNTNMSKFINRKVVGTDYIIGKVSNKFGIFDRNYWVKIDFMYDEISYTYKSNSYEIDKFYGTKKGVKEEIKFIKEPTPEKPPVKPTNLTAKLPTFDITLNGIKINNNNRIYPFIVCNDITYFPMTYFDSRFLNLTTEWDMKTGLKIYKTTQSGAYVLDSAKITHPSVIKPTLANFDIHINGRKIDNANEPYPLILYKDVTYFPMTWKFGVDEFGWDYKYSEAYGLQINSN